MVGNTAASQPTNQPTIASSKDRARLTAAADQQHPEEISVKDATLQLIAMLQFHIAKLHGARNFQNRAGTAGHLSYMMVEEPIGQ